MCAVRCYCACSVVINVPHKKFEGDIVGKQGTVLSVTHNGWVKVQVGGNRTSIAWFATHISCLSLRLVQAIGLHRMIEVDNMHVLRVVHVSEVNAFSSLLSIRRLLACA